jgi:hypothetical protein
VLPPLAPRAGVLGFDDPGRDEVEVMEVFPLPLPLEAGIVEMYDGCRFGARVKLVAML